MNKYKPDKVHHPSETLWDYIDDNGLTSGEMSQIMGVPYGVLFEFLTNEKRVTGYLASKLEESTNIPAHFWRNKQAAYDEFKRPPSADYLEHRVEGVINDYDNAIIEKYEAVSGIAEFIIEIVKNVSK